jgi:hypothetical protein
MDGKLGIIKSRWLKKIKKRLHFILVWGVYAYNVTPFGLCNDHVSFQNMVIQTFKEYLNEFLQLFLDNFTVYGNKNNHTNQLIPIK